MDRKISIPIFKTQLRIGVFVHSNHVECSEILKIHQLPIILV